MRRRLARFEHLEPRYMLSATVLEHNDVGYFFLESSPRVRRYSIASEEWLSTVALANGSAGATAGHVDDDGIYVAYGKSVYRYNSDGSGQTFLLNAQNNVIAIHSDGPLLFLNHTNGSYTRFISVDKTTNTVIDTIDDYLETVYGSSIAPEANRIFGRTWGTSPSDITYVEYDDNGQFTANNDSPYHGDYPRASRTWVFPNDSKVVDDSGTIYSTSGLTRLNSFATTIDDIDFLGADVPIVLSGDTLTAYTSGILPTGSTTLSGTPSEIFVNDTNVITFTPDPLTGYQTEIIPLANLDPPTPGQPVDPVGLPYTPDKVELAADGTVLLYSKSHQSIFRWDPVNERYEDTIPLIGTAEFMAYSSETNTVYLAYESGLIRSIDLDVAQPVEEPFAVLPDRPLGLSTAGKYVFAVDPSGAWESHYTFDPDGILIEEVDWNYTSPEYVWSDANQKMYFSRDTSPTDLLWEEINADGVTYPSEPAGGIGAKKDSPLHTSTGFWHPIRVAPDGSVVVLGSGYIHDATTLERQTTALANSITDATWLGGELYTVRNIAGPVQFQHWVGPSYGLRHVTQRPGTAHSLISIPGDRLLAITIDSEGIPVFTSLNENLEDTTFTAGFSVSETLGDTSVNESGTNDTLTVVLREQPASDVVIDVTSGDTGEVTVAPASLTFTSSNWDTPQVVTATGVDDSDVDGSQTTPVVFSVNDAASDDGFDDASDLIVAVVTVDNETVVSWVAEHDNVGCFFVETDTRIERYDITNEVWLAPIILAEASGAATVGHVDDDGIYVAYGKAVYRYNLDGSGRTHLVNTQNDVIAIHSDGNLLFLNHTYSHTARVISIDKATNTIIDTIDDYLDTVYGSSIAPGVNRIIGRTRGVSPSDIAYVEYTDDGRFWANNGSVYHGDYPGASQTWVFPDGSKVVDDSGTVYSTSDLTWLNKFASSIDDIDFLGTNTPIILSGNTLTAYTSSILPAASVTLGNSPSKIFVNDTNIIALTPDPTLSTAFRAEIIPLSDLDPPTPGEPVDPVGLPYTPDKVELAADGTILLYSKSHQSIFRWDPVDLGYEQTIPLIGPAEFMAYSSETNTVYLAYESGLIRSIDLDAAQPVEEPFTILPDRPLGLSTAGRYLFAVDPSGAWESHYTFGPDGALIDAVDWNYTSPEYVWSDTNQKMYFSRDSSPTDLLWEEINADGATYPSEPAGGIGAKKDSPLHSSAGFSHPFRVAPDGSVVVLGSGYIHDAITLERQTLALANSIVDAAWLGDKLYTARNISGVTQFQHWSQPTYALEQVLQKPGSTHSLMAIGDDRLLAITMGSNGIPVFTLMNDALEENVSSISGCVYADVNNDGIKDPQESGIQGVTIIIDGVTSRRTTTDEFGFYQADRLLPGTYTVTEQQPLAFVDGIDTVGESDGANLNAAVIAKNTFQVDLEPRVALSNFNFGEQCLQTNFVSTCQYPATVPCENPLDGLSVPATSSGESSAVTFRATGSGLATVSAGGGATLQLFDTMMRPIAGGSSGTVTADLVSGNGYVLYVAGNSTEIELHVDSAEVTLTATSVPLHNCIQRTDVNLDGETSPLDVLSLIYHFVTQGGEPTRPVFLDVTRDRIVSPLDVLTTIEVVNRNAASAAGGEGDARHATPAGSAHLMLDARPSAAVRESRQDDHCVEPQKQNSPSDRSAACLPPASTRLTRWGEPSRNPFVASPDDDIVDDYDLEYVISLVQDDVACVWSNQP